ncbi:MAG TPA: hypothetical protein VFJ58_27995, partial [Armatimonadota bacterium]|nr:hypothetical protein [Armatimonadota bacterium]
MELFNSRMIGSRRLIATFLPVLIATATAVPAGAISPSYSYFPTASATDSRMLAIGGAGADCLGAIQLNITLGVPASSPTFELGIFDGDTGKTPAGTLDPGSGHWDGGSTQLMYSLYADPLADGHGTTLLAEWTGNDSNPISGPGWVSSSPTMPDNDWWNVVFLNSPVAQAKSGNYFYDLRCVLQDPMTNAVSAFKVRAAGSVVLNPMSFGFEAALASMEDLHTVYPAFTGNTLPGPGSQFWLNTPTTYDGKWTFYMDVPPASKDVTLWDGEFDFGTDPTQLFGTPSGVPIQQTADTDDPDTGHIVPAFCASPHVLPQGAQGAGNPADDSAIDFIRRSPSVIYNLTDPTGNVYWNANPSGKMEWEQFKITSDPSATRSDADYGPNVAADGKTFVQTSTLPGGIWKINVLGLDLGNTSHFHPFAPVLGVDDNGNPTPPLAVNPPVECSVSSTLLWPPNHDMVNVGLAVTP